MEPPAGDAPAGILYKRNPQAAAWKHALLERADALALNAESEIVVFARRRTTLTKGELLLLLLLLLGGIQRKSLSQNDGAGEGNRTLVTGIVVLSGVK